ncbi:MAG: hypothetical protein ACJAT4_002616 [Granulosicoccus sp.]|jgi:hypothetical protein
MPVNGKTTFEAKWELPLYKKRDSRTKFLNPLSSTSFCSSISNCRSGRNDVLIGYCNVAIVVKTHEKTVD